MRLARLVPAVAADSAIARVAQRRLHSWLSNKLAQLVHPVLWEWCHPHLLQAQVQAQPAPVLSARCQVRTWHLCHCLTLSLCYCDQAMLLAEPAPELVWTRTMSARCQRQQAAAAAVAAEGQQLAPACVQTHVACAAGTEQRGTIMHAVDVAMTTHH